MKLAEQNCQPAATMAPLSRKEAEALLLQVPGWSLIDNQISREFRFKNFGEAMDFVNRIAALANEQDHHPDIVIVYNKVKLTLTTHKIGGLSVNDFIMAAKADLAGERQAREKAA
jgi:4a-hydroxytetrahydrobiopterin dehydratase